jgi:predicted nucleic acid-binding protein
VVVLDSSVIIDVLRQRKEALAILEKYSDKGRIATTAINRYEVLRGDMHGLEKELVAELLGKFLIYDLDESSISAAITMYRKLSEKGRMINDLDLLIAGITAANNELFITKDRDFGKLESDSIITV